jgi:hypothetical protein
MEAIMTMDARNAGNERTRSSSSESTSGRWRKSVISVLGRDDIPRNLPRPAEQVPGG